MRRGGLGPWKFLFLLVTCWVTFSTSVFAQIGQPSQGRLRMELAEAWAPVVYQDVSEASVDQVVDLFFDGNRDLRDNAWSIRHLTATQVEEINREAPVYFSIAETRTHYYLNYIFYHAIDLNGLGHAHDTENAFLVIEKDDSKLGRLLAVITNAHGYPMIYSPDKERELLWRKHIHLGLGRRFLPYFDFLSEAHHEEGVLQSIRRENSVALKLFVARKSHAIYKFNHEAFLSQASVTQPRGIFYVPKSCLECFSDLTVRGHDRSIPYVLRDFDSLFEDILENEKTTRVNAQSSMPSTTQSARQVSQIFAQEENEGQEPDEEDDSYNAGIYRPRLLPKALIAGRGEERTAANLFFENSFKTPFALRDPAAMHRFFEEGDSKISQEYLSNAYLSLRARPLETPLAQKRQRGVLKIIQAASPFHFWSRMLSLYH